MRNRFECSFPMELRGNASGWALWWFFGVPTHETSMHEPQHNDKCFGFVYLFWWQITCRHSQNPMHSQLHLRIHTATFAHVQHYICKLKHPYLIILLLKNGRTNFGDGLNWVYEDVVPNGCVSVNLECSRLGAFQDFFLITRNAVSAYTKWFWRNKIGRTNFGDYVNGMCGGVAP